MGAKGGKENANLEKLRRLKELEKTDAAGMSKTGSSREKLLGNCEV